jgi:CRP-like cAMP-binding protein
MTEVNKLRKVSFFAEVPEEMLARMGLAVEELSFKAGDVVFRQGEPAERFYGLLEGEIELSLVFKDKVLKTEIEYEEAIQARMVDQEKQIVVDAVKPGQVFGWAALVAPEKRTVTAKCATDCRIAALAAADLKALLAANPGVGYGLLEKLCRIISQRLENRTEKLIETWVEAFDAGEI